MSTMISIRLAAPLALLVILQLTVLVQSGAIQTLINKTAEAANNTEPVEEVGGIRATILHTGANLLVDKTLDVIEKRYPVVTPFRGLAKPVVNVIHQKINSFKNRDTATTTPAPTDKAPETEQPGEKKLVEDEKVPAEDEKQGGAVAKKEEIDDNNDKEAKQNDKEEIKVGEKNTKKGDKKKGDKKKGDKKKGDKKKDADQEKDQRKAEKKDRKKDKVKAEGEEERREKDENKLEGVKKEKKN